VLIIHNVVIDRDVNEMLEKLDVDCYTKFTNTLGKGKLSDPHLNTEVWPGVNYGTLVITDDEKAGKIVQTVRLMRENLAHEGLKAFMWNIEDQT